MLSVFTGHACVFRAVRGRVRALLRLPGTLRRRFIIRDSPAFGYGGYARRFCLLPNCQPKVCVAAFFGATACLISYSASIRRCGL